MVLTSTGSKFTVANEKGRWGKKRVRGTSGKREWKRRRRRRRERFSSVLCDDVKFTVWLQSEPLGAVSCGLLAVGVASWWWAWPLGCGFLLPSTSGGNSVYYLRASVLFSHGSQQARGLGIAAAILNPGFTRKDFPNRKFIKKNKSKLVKLVLFLAASC